MGILAFALLVLVGLYLIPQLAPNLRWLALVAGLAVSAGVAAWRGWVDMQGDSIAQGVTGVVVLLGGIAAAMGVAVRALVLWRGWEGGRRSAAVGIGCAVLVAGVTLLIGGVFWG